MFEVPDAKRVRREDLYDSSSDEESAGTDEHDPSLQQKLNAQLSGLLDISFTANENVEALQASESTEPHNNASKLPEEEGDAEEAGEEAFAFRLFRDENSSHKVVLEAQDAGLKSGDDGFVIAKRPMSYYVAREISPKMAQEFASAAVSAEYILEDAGKRRWGLEKPWKVTTITITTDKRLTPSKSQTDDSTAMSRKKKRPGKKRRIILRVRDKAKKEREEAAKRQVVDKEEHLKEKRKRLNRQKKLKRRAKGREKKQGAQDDAGSEPSSRASSPDKEQD
ncbi:hypothetical protein GGR52DRAFT_555188 [Hypoxylon sp. FL1284]|nr:hypothetical protein GGR52DRAFT_555188 [Hypoxylon sp. FL1284]